ncbi:hypothetical protein ACJX0J_024349, partial [Zea mays]
EEVLDDFVDGGVDDLVVSLYQMDLDRTLFLLRSYLLLEKVKSSSSKGGNVSKKTKASTRQLFATNSNSTWVRSVGLRVASSFKQDDGFLADGVSIAHWYPSKRKIEKLAYTEEYIDEQFSRNLGEILI